MKPWNLGQSARPVRTGPVQFVSGPWLDATKSRRSGEYGSSGDPGGSGETVTSPDGERKRPAEGRSQAQGRSLATRKPTLMSENPTGVLTRFRGAAGPRQAEPGAAAHHVLPARGVRFDGGTVGRCTLIAVLPAVLDHS